MGRTLKIRVRLASRQLISPIRQKCIYELLDLMSTLLSKCRAVLIVNEGRVLPPIQY